MNILVTAIGSLSASAVINRLRQAGHKVIGCDIYPQSWIWNSALVSRFYRAPSLDDKEAYIDFISACCEEEQLDLIIPLTDPEVDLLSAQRNRVSSGITLAIPDSHTVLLARNKLLWYQAFFSEPQIRLIPTFALDNYAPGGEKFPLIIKPCKGRSSQGIEVINSTADLAYWQRKHAGQHYLVQPLLSGEVYVVDIVRHNLHDQSVCIGRKELLRTVNGAGLTVQLCQEAALIEPALEVAARLNLNGCINLEFLKTDEGFHLMDINPRFSAGVEFSLMAGYDMVLNHLRCFGPKKLLPVSDVSDRIFTRHYVVSEYMQDNYE